jgi:hypothetical protein
MKNLIILTVTLLLVVNSFAQNQGKTINLKGQ